MDPISALGEWLQNLFLGWGLSEVGAIAIIKLLAAFALGMVSLLLVVFTIWLERKLYARIQDRLGPNRVGPWGIFQTIPDMIKIFTKEYITPQGADKVVYNLAPILVVSGVILLWGVIPFAPNLVGTQVNVGVLYLVAAGAIGTLGLIMAGYSSNNKYSLVAAFRVVAQMVSYEVPMVLALLVPVILSQSMGLNTIVEAQEGPLFLNWFVFASPLAAILFFIASQAEIGRAPFDLMEAESEIVAGYQTEYSGLKFGMFYVGEFMHAFTVSAICAAIFFGGWQGPGADQTTFLGMFLGLMWFVIKSFIIYFFVIVLRISMPRLRIDQLLNFNWKFLTPIALVLLMVTALVEKAMLELEANALAASGVHFLANVMLGLLIVLWLRRIGQKPGAKTVAEPRPVAVAPKS